MAQLDNKRKFALMIIVIVVITCAFIGASQTPPVAPAPAPEAQTALFVAPAVQTAAAQPAQPAAESSQSTQPTQPTPKLVVLQDNTAHNHYVLSGFMPTGKCVAANDAWQDNCQEGRRCLQVTYDADCSRKDQGWAGMYWLSPANNWGDQKGGTISPALKNLVFWARGQQGGEVIDSFKVGGITGEGHKFPDSDTAGIGPITLTKEWQQYSVDLRGKDLSHIGGGFAWAANTQDNPQGVKFYLDNIYYE